MRWKLVPGFADLFASDAGLLMVAPRRVTLPGGVSRHYGGVPTKGQWDGKRFIYRLRGRTYRVARLICSAFHGPAPSSSMVCMHIDEDASNNAPSNLRWGTQRENLNCPKFLDYCRNRTGENSPRTKYFKRNLGAA